MPKLSTKVEMTQGTEFTTADFVILKVVIKMKNNSKNIFASTKISRRKLAI